jgi:MazG family protein
VAREARYPLDPLVQVMERLLGPGGCPWDQEQDHRSLRPYVVEEAYEVVAAIDAGDPDKLKEELGDLLLQVVFHAALAARERRFDMGEVVDGIVAKLVRRHPHVFGERQASSASAVLRQWEDIKREEAASDKRRAGVRSEAHLPALMQAQKLLERAARTGRPVRSVIERAAAGLGPGEDDLARRLLCLLEEARERGLDAELVLKQAGARMARELDDV